MFAATIQRVWLFMIFIDDRVCDLCHAACKRESKMKIMDYGTGPDLI